MYILQKLKLRSLPLAIEMHQPGIHFYYVLKKHHLLTSLKVLLTKIHFILFYFLFYFIMMSIAIGKLKHA